MTKYYLFTPEDLATHPGIEADILEPAIKTAMREVGTGATFIILEYFRTATKGDAPIIFDKPLPDPPPPKRGRPSKPKGNVLPPVQEVLK